MFANRIIFWYQIFLSNLRQQQISMSHTELLGPIINVNVNLHNVAFPAHVYCFKSLGIKRKEKAWLLIPSAAFYAQLCTFRIFIQCEKLFTPWQALCWWKSVRKPLINIVKNKGDLYTSTTRETSEMIREIYGFE